VEGFKQSWKTSEAIVGILGILLSLLMMKSVPLAYFYLGIFTSLNAFILARTIYKKNRGLYHSGFKTAEFWSHLLSQAITVTLWLWGLRSMIAFCGIIGSAMIYMISRGITKSKDSTLLRHNNITLGR